MQFQPTIEDEIHELALTTVLSMIAHLDSRTPAAGGQAASEARMALRHRSVAAGCVLAEARHSNAPSSMTTFSPMVTAGPIRQFLPILADGSWRGAGQVMDRG